MAAALYALHQSRWCRNRFSTSRRSMGSPAIRRSHRCWSPRCSGGSAPGGRARRDGVDGGCRAGDCRAAGSGAGAAGCGRLDRVDWRRRCRHTPGVRHRGARPAARGPDDDRPGAADGGGCLDARRRHGRTTERWRGTSEPPWSGATADGTNTADDDDCGRPNRCQLEPCCLLVAPC